MIGKSSECGSTQRKINTESGAGGRGPFAVRSVRARLVVPFAVPAREPNSTFLRVRPSGMFVYPCFLSTLSHVVKGFVFCGRVENRFLPPVIPCLVMSYLECTHDSDLTLRLLLVRPTMTCKIESTSYTNSWRKLKSTGVTVVQSRSRPESPAVTRRRSVLGQLFISFSFFAFYFTCALREQAFSKNSLAATPNRAIHDFESLQLRLQTTLNPTPYDFYSESG